MQNLQFYDQFNRPMPRRKIVAELGTTGTLNYSGYISGEEYRTKLQGMAGLTIYDQMRRSCAQIKAGLAGITLPIRQTVWMVEPASGDNKDQEIAEFVSNNLFGGMSITWDDFLRQALLYLPFGFMVFEQVYKVENGKILLKKLAPRLPKTIQKWNIDNDNGGLKSITQFAMKGTSYENIEIPIKKLLIFTNEKEGDNFEGISILRPAVINWEMLMNFYKIAAIFYDRWGAGTPVVSMPENKTKNNDPTNWAAAIAMAEGLRSNEKAYVVEPHGYAIKMLEQPAKGAMNIMLNIKDHQRAIALNFLNPGQDLGNTGGGNRALGEVHNNSFLLSVQGYIGYLEETITRYCIKALVDYNFTVDRYPKLKASKVKEASFIDLADAINKLAGAGALTVDDEIEEYVRKVGKLPPKSEKQVAPGNKKATEKCTCGHAKRLVEGTYYRELYEQEKCLNLREIDNRIGRAKDLLTNKIIEIQEEQIGRLAKDVAANPVNARMRKVSLLATIIKGELLDIYRYGRDQVKQEIAKQKKNPIRLAEERATTKNLKKAKLNPIRIPEDAQAFIESKANLVSAQMAKKYENTALFAELEAQKLGLSKAATITFITDRLTELTDKEAKAAAQYSVTEAFGIGRNVEAEVHKDEIKTSYYSAILDGNVCEVCAPLDGIEHELNDPAYETPNPNCLGTDNRCRCLTVYIMKTEQEPSR